MDVFSGCDRTPEQIAEVRARATKLCVEIGDLVMKRSNDSRDVAISALVNSLADALCCCNGGVELVEAVASMLVQLTRHKSRLLKLDEATSGSEHIH
jgi:hypothetical protein